MTEIKNRYTGAVIYTHEGANLAGANLYGANLTGANLTGVVVPAHLLIPALLTLDNDLLALLQRGTGNIDMSAWHSCATTHCRAGWALTLAGEAGAALEEAVGTSLAAALLYARAYPDLPVPNFYATNEEAVADITARAARSPHH